MKNSFLYTAVALVLSAGCAAPHGPAAGNAAGPPMADVSGVWQFNAETPAGFHAATMYVVQNGKEINGRFEGELGVMHYVGSVSGNEVEFSHMAMAGAMRFEYKGAAIGEEMRGNAVFGTLGNGAWTATRERRE